MSYFGLSKYVSPPVSPVGGRKSPVRSHIIPFCTSPSQLNEVSTCPDFTFSNSLRSPEGPMRGRSVKEVEEQLAGLKRENFNLKLRIYFLEERMGANFNLDKENIVKNNVELMVETESLKKELQEKHELLCQAVKAMDLEEEEFKKNAQSKNDEILSLRQEVEDLRLQLQEVRYENDTESSHKSYHSEPIFLSSQILPLPESSSRVRILQERIASLENELAQEKENNASLQMILDQADIINTKYEQLRIESEKKDETIRDLNKELNTAKEKISKISDQVRDLEKFKDTHMNESLKLTKLLTEKSFAVEQLEENISGLRKKYAMLKSDLEKERQKFDRTKFVSDLKATEMEEELEKQRGRVIDLQKKLGSAHQELKENQNLLVAKSSKGRSIATNTDCDNVSVSNAATSLGVPKANALCDALGRLSLSKSPVKSFDFNTIYNILNPIMFSNKSQLMKHLAELKDTLSKSEQKIVHLKAQEMKACALIKNLMEQHRKWDSQVQTQKKRIAQLEKELEGVVSKPEGKGSSTRDHQNSEDNRNENECKALINELENKIKILELTLKEKDIHVEYIEAQNLELMNSLQNKEKDMINLEQSKSTTGEESENAKECTNKLYNQLFEEKNKEIEKLNEELKKRTNDLQAVVNNELWEKNREIEKLQIKYSQLLGDKEKEMGELKKSFVLLSENLEQLKIEYEQKHFENSNLKVDISDLNLQLQLLKDKIGEVGLIPDDKLEVEFILSSLDDIKDIQKELQDVKTEREILTKKVNDLEIAVHSSENFIIENTQDKQVDILRGQLEMSEALRRQTTAACNLLRSQLEELAMFLDSLMKQKSVLGFLGSSQNKKLREAIDQSLDLSKSLNVSLTMNSEQSLMQLSNITALLNCSDVSNLTGNEDISRYSLGILPEQATLTYQNHIFNVKNEKNDEHQSFIVKSLEDQIEMLQRELKMKNNELSRMKRESRSGKDLKLSHTKTRISPSKLKNVLTNREDKNDSESESWSEPDVNVSKARIGLFKDDEAIGGIEEIQSSDSTDESITHLNNRRSDLLNECQLTITKLNKQIQDLQVKLQEKENVHRQLEEANETIISLKEDNEMIKTQISDLNSELSDAKTKLKLSQEQNGQTQQELNDLKNKIEEMDLLNKELRIKYDSKDKEMCNKINQMKFEREQLVHMSIEYANMTESSRQEVLKIEKKLTQLTIEKENLENKLKKEYENNLEEKLKDCEKEFTDRLLEVESKTHQEVEELSAKIVELSKDYADNYVKKSIVDEKVSEVNILKSELETLKKCFNDCKKSVERSGNDEKKMKEEINKLQTKINHLTLQYSHAVLEKSSLEQKFNEANNTRIELESELHDEKKELLSLKEHYQKEFQLLEAYKSKLELKVSELEFCNAELHHRLARLQAETGDHIYSTSLPLNPRQNDEIGSKPLQINQNSPYARQISNNSQSYMSEDEVRTRGVFSIVSPQKSVDSDRIEANSSPDLGIESDQGRFSSLEVQTQLPRPLLPTIEIAESMNSLLDGDNNSVQESECGNKSCYQKSMELTQENNLLKRKLMKTKKALEDTVTQLTIANQRKKQVERNICRQIHKTSQVLREAKANLDSGSETDFHKK